MAFKFIIDNGRTRVERTIEELVNGEGKISLGIASGMDIGHCFYIASRHCRVTKDFLRDVDYYRICSEEKALDPGCTITIEFYKKS